jgi:hypothetical protein
VANVGQLSVDWKNTSQLYGLRSERDALVTLDSPGALASVSSSAMPEESTPVTASREYRFAAPIEELRQSLFRNRAVLKILTSQVAMHLNSEERNNLFASIDRLLDAGEWEDESSEIDDKAFRSYLRFTIYARPHRVPNLGVGPSGTLLAGWHKEENSIYIEFFPDDQCVGIFRFSSGRGTERIAWRGHVARVREVIENNRLADCID